MPQIVNAVTGWNTDVKELMNVGARRVNLMRVFNAREGLTREEDKLSPRLHQPLKGGVSDGLQVTEAELEWAKDLYYRHGRLGRGDRQPHARAAARVGARVDGPVGLDPELGFLKPAAFDAASMIPTLVDSSWQFNLCFH